MKEYKRHICSVFLLFLALSVALSLFSCVARPVENETLPGLDTEKDTFTPAVDDGESSELYARYTEYKENASLAFKDFSEAEATDFEYEFEDTGVAITKYIGESNIVVVPDDIDGVPVVKINSGTFSGPGLRAVYIPNTVLHLEKGVFTDCGGLSTLRLPFIGDGDEKMFLGHIFGADSPDENAIMVPVSLDMLILGDQATEIARHALRRCKTLSAVILPDSVKEIGDLAFYECGDLVYVSLGKGVDKIGELAFGYCQSLYEIDCSNVENIAQGAFYETSSLNNITIFGFDEENAYLGYIFGSDRVDYHHKFVPDSLRCVRLVGAQSIPDLAFASCKHVTSVDIGKNVEIIGIRAFYNCRSLSKIAFSDSLREICDDAFFGCESFTEIELCDGVEVLGAQAFYGCKSLVSVSLSQSLKEIKPSTFSGCRALKTVALGGVEKIGKDAFRNCDSLIPPDTKQISDIADGNDALFEVEQDSELGK